MNLIDPKVELINQDSGLEGIYKQIELVGRSCWMSQNLITPDSAKKFVESLSKNTHNSPLEHGTVYLTIPIELDNLYNSYKNNPYSKCYLDDNYAYVTTNYRVIVEYGWESDLMYLTNPTKHKLRYTFHFTCQRAISAEFNRHRVNSPMESSSRYCNFSKDKFGNEISICPSQWVENKWIEINSKEPHDSITDDLNYSNLGLERYCYEVANHYEENNMNIIDFWWFANLACEFSYMNMLRLGAKPEEARDVLPLDLKTELYHTAFKDDWKHFCELRAWDSKGNKPHPEAKLLGEQVWNLINN